MPLYHAIVRRLLRNVFAQLSAGNYEYILGQMAPQFEHIFSGTHPLGGTRHTVGAMRSWFERLYRLSPNLQFETRAMAVSGPPWDTRATVEWIDRATLADGQPYINRGVHFVRLRWGKVVSLHAYLDTQTYADACRRMAENGIDEAAAAPIED